MPTSWSFQAHVPAPPDAVYAWMSDFREDDHARPAFRRGAGVKEGDRKVSHRKVLSREGNVVTLEDSWGRERFPMKARLDPARREVRLEGQYGYHGTWRAEPDGSGTRLVSEGRLEPKGVMRLLAPLFAKAFLKQMQADFNGHVEDAKEELAAHSSRASTSPTR